MDTPAAVPQIHSTDIFCPHCGYNLRGTDALRCPECGKEHKPEELATNRIPWTYRKSIGRVRAFIRTVDIATFHPRQLAMSFDSGIAWRDARRFRRMCILPLLLGLIGVLLAQEGWEQASLAPGYLLRPSNIPPVNYVNTWLLQIGIPWYIAMRHWSVVVAAVLFAAQASSILPVRLLSFARFPEERRSAVLSAAQYLSGALLGGAMLGGALVIWMRVAGLQGMRQPGLFLAFAVAVPAITALLCWALACWRFYRQVGMVTGTSLVPFWLLFLPVMLLTGAIWFFILPSCAGLLLMITQTLLRLWDGIGNPCGCIKVPHRRRAKKLGAHGGAQLRQLSDYL